MHDDYYVLAGRKKERLRRADYSSLAKRSPICYAPQQKPETELRKLAEDINEAVEKFRLCAPDEILAEAIEKQYTRRVAKQPYKARMSWSEAQKRKAEQ